KLRRSLFGGLRLTRRDRGGCRVFVAVPGLGRREVVRGPAVRVAKGDRIEVETPDDPRGRVVLTVGGWEAEPAGDQSSGFDDPADPGGWRDPEARWLG